MAKRYGRWKTVGSIDEGRQAHVFLVVDSQGEWEGQHVLKRLKNQGRLDLFEREVKAMETLRHPHVLRVVDYNLKGNSPYYVAEYCDGRSLDKMGAERYKANIQGTVAVLLPIVEALIAAHEAGVVHRDVKPPNILFRADGTPVLGDFGICHIEGARRVTLSDEAMGSVNYIAPEMESGRHRPVTSAADVYALGKVMYWMLSGGRIFAREDHRAPAVYLPNLLRAQRWEHVHALFDHMIVEDLARRNPTTLMRSLFEQTEDLVMGDYMPLRPSLGLTCQWCGLGKYAHHPYLAGGQGHIAWVRSSALRALKCSHCGHLELFDLQGVANAKWMDT
ncbi:MAG: serine/threonine-protein kinase [Candidatus Rokuibacteriota bacterium]